MEKTSSQTLNIDKPDPRESQQPLSSNQSEQEQSEQCKTMIEEVRINENFNIVTTNNGMTLLQTLIKNKKTDLIQQLLSAVTGPSEDHWKLMSFKYKQKTALHYACIAGSTEIASLFFRICPPDKHWALLTEVCCCRKTALHYASRLSNDIEIVKLLLEHSKMKDVDLIAMKDSESKTALDYATATDIRYLLTFAKKYYWRLLDKGPTTLIFYNDFKEYPLHRREDADEEKDYMVQAFERCGIEPIVIKDFTEKKLEEKLEQVIKKENGDISALIVVIMSHGYHGVVYDADYHEVPLQNIINRIGYKSQLSTTAKVILLSPM